MIELAPITLREANRFVATHHRHNGPVRGWLFGTSLIGTHGEVLAVGLAGRPLARPLDNGRNLELSRICVRDGVAPDRNACSRLYGALCRAGKALGWHRAYTYTLAEEDGTSLLAAGFELDEVLDARPTWDGGARHRVQVDLFGEDRRPPGPKARWIRELRR